MNTTNDMKIIQGSSAFRVKAALAQREAQSKNRKEPVTLKEVERRMRPGAYSTEGFLGRTESLETVIAQDRRTLEVLGISHEQIAKALEDVLHCVESQKRDLLAAHSPALMKRDLEECIPYLHRPESIPRYTLDNLPEIDTGYLVGPNLQVFIAQYRGIQECPWGCEEGGSFDFLILNRRLGKLVTGPSLIVHLIRQHHFFEGFESPYRLDPAGASQVLELVSNAGHSASSDGCGSGLSDRRSS